VPELPIWIAALGQHTMDVAAELGDGWIPALLARDRRAAWTARLSQRREAVAPHARALTVATGPNHGRRRRPRHGQGDRRRLRGLVPECHGRRLRPVPDRAGLCRRGQRGHRREPASRPAARRRPARSPRVVLDQLAACGTSDQVREQLGPSDRAADIVAILLPPGMPWGTVEATIRAGAPAGIASTRELAAL
jgi:alkanesulfonate monooxygenase SsuD/methylene tetrahydromethanopterin reductase-like flavin-dependent oxidoreductase (luciferase family)